MSSDWEYGDFSCPKCGTTTRFMRCNELGCDDGYIDMHEYDDPMFFDEGEYERCENCKGMGVLHWCGNCGYDLTPADMNKQIEASRE